MPIMAVQDQNDVRGSARVLATAAKRYIDHLPSDDRHVPAMNGVFRLLKLHRATDLQGYEYRPRMERGPDAVYMLPSGNRHVADLRKALDQALLDAAGGKEPNLPTTIDSIQHALKGFATKEGQVDEGERKLVTLFLEALLERLSPSD